AVDPERPGGPASKRPACEELIKDQFPVAQHLESEASITRVEARTRVQSLARAERAWRRRGNPLVVPPGEVAVLVLLGQRGHESHALTLVPERRALREVAGHERRAEPVREPAALGIVAPHLRLVGDLGWISLRYVAGPRAGDRSRVHPPALIHAGAEPVPELSGRA